jgi:phosphate transport system permease protein
VDALTGDLAFDSAETLSAFGLGLVLFVVTLLLNVISTVVIRRFKQQYEL